MKKSDDIFKDIKQEIKLLTDINDCVGINIGNNKGLFIQVVDYGEGAEYLVELNNINSDGAYEPCASYNVSSPFGELEQLKETVKEYINNNIVKE